MPFHSSLFCVRLFRPLFKILVMWGLAKCWKPILQCRFCPFLHLSTTRGSEKTDSLLIRGHFKWRILSRTSTEQSGKNEKKNISHWASSTPWGHVLSLKTFCRNPVLSWAIRYSVFQKVKSTSSLEFVCDDPFSTFWHLMVKFG